METLKNLYSLYIENEPPADTPDASEIHRKFYAWLDTITDKELAELIDNHFSAARLEYERQGFCRGFQYAMKIAA